MINYVWLNVARENGVYDDVFNLDNISHFSKNNNGEICFFKVNGEEIRYSISSINYVITNDMHTHSVLTLLIPEVNIGLIIAHDWQEEKNKMDVRVRSKDYE